MLPVTVVLGVSSLPLPELQPRHISRKTVWVPSVLVCLLSFFVLHKNHMTFLVFSGPISIILFGFASLLRLGLLGQFWRIAKLEMLVF